MGNEAMMTVMQAARGASAFSQTDRSPFSPATEGGPIISRAADDSAQAWSQVIDELLRIRMLPDDWDGQGTEAPHPSLVHGAITLAQRLLAGGTPPADRVIASVNGTIYFEWHTPLGYQEIEVTSPVDAECRWVEKGSDLTAVVKLTRRP